MPNLFEMLSTITRRKSAEDWAPFDSERTVRKWLKSLPEESDYDAHHALVDGLERFNAENADANAECLKMLMAIEEAGLPLQFRIVELYMRYQSSFPLANQTLWNESRKFWSLLGVAWFNMFKHAYKGPARLELQPWRAEIATRALRYAGLSMRWDCHNSQLPSAASWHIVHNIYRMVERDGFADESVVLNARRTNCSREYSLTVMMGMMNPLGCKAQELEAIAQLFEGFPDLPLPEASFQSSRHTHAVDLSVDEGAFVLDDNQPTGKQLRFFALAPLVEHLQSIEPLSNREGEEGLYRQIAKLVSRDDVRRSSQRIHRFKRVWVATGMGNILASLASVTGGNPRQAMEPWMLRDESADGMGFSLEASTALPHGRLIAVSSDPSANNWQLLAIRWNRKAGGQLLVGAQRLSRRPRRVEISIAEATSDAPRAPTHAVFLPGADTEGRLSNLLLPQTYYQPGAQISFRDGDSLFRASLGQVYESHERWVRVGMDVLGRERFAAAA